MTDTDRDLLAPLLPSGEPVEQLLRKAQFFVPGKPSADYRELHRVGGRKAEEFWHERWRHDKVVRSTHGVNCTDRCPVRPGPGRGPWPGKQENVNHEC